MTAEIAVLNKSAVALAADSAVTIAAVKTQQKVYDSADKLFELSDVNPIGVMIYNGMQFAQAPISSLICDFRRSSKGFATVELASIAFLEMLNLFGKTSPSEVKKANVISIISPILHNLSERANKKFTEYVTSSDLDPKSLIKRRNEIYSDTIDTYERIYLKRADASFIGIKKPKFDEGTRRAISDAVGQMPLSQALSTAQKKKVERVARLALTKDVLSPGRTGIVIAGFGSDEQFPTLVSYEIDGIICNSLKFIKTNTIDIDRSGPRASVIPFAQKEMVERFLLGMDERIQDELTSFCRKTVSKISEELMGMVTFDDDSDKTSMQSGAQTAEDAFVAGLKEEAFRKIREQSKREVEDMVEFMPKPELAKMAEALVNLTSIKRRVTRGMETVGGPIDVAIISRTEGFIWVKRKHYFEGDLNPRYVHRVRNQK